MPGDSHIIEADHIIANDYSQLLQKQRRGEESHKFIEHYAQYERRLTPEQGQLGMAAYNEGISALGSNNDQVPVDVKVETTFRHLAHYLTAAAPETDCSQSGYIVLNSSRDITE